MKNCITNYMQEKHFLGGFLLPVQENFDAKFTPFLKWDLLQGCNFSALISNSNDKAR